MIHCAYPYNIYVRIFTIVTKVQTCSYVIYMDVCIYIYIYVDMLNVDIDMYAYCFLNTLYALNVVYLCACAMCVYVWFFISFLFSITFARSLSASMFVNVPFWFQLACVKACRWASCCWSFDWLRCLRLTTYWSKRNWWQIGMAGKTHLPPLSLISFCSVHSQRCVTATARQQQ